MDGDVAETYHVFHGLGACGGEEVGVGKQLEGIAAGLGDSEAIPGDAMHGEVDRRLAGPEDVKNDRVLVGEIVKSRGVVPIFLRDTGKAASNVRGLVEVDVVNHGAMTASRSSFNRA